MAGCRSSKISQDAPQLVSGDGQCNYGGDCLHDKIITWI